MKTRGIKFLFISILLVFIANSAMATTLPDNVLTTIKKDFPKALVRFDGLITLPNGTVYLPVLPSNPKRNAEGKVIVTVPSNKKLSQMPDVVIFDSNFALLKIIKDKNGGLTVIDSKDIPFVVKTGLLPQDLLVPPGLVIPDDLEIMMGDLKIKTVSSRVNDIFKNSDEIKKGYVNKSIVPVPFMSNKTLLVTSLDSKVVNFIHSDSTAPVFSLTMENLPKFIMPVSNDDYLLVAASGKTYIDVADIKNEVIAKKIDLAYQPTEVILTSDKTKAYVAVGDAQAIFSIDLKTMTLLEKIKVKGYPKNIAISDDNSIIVYQDKNSGDIYTLSLNEVYVNKYVYNVSNVSKLAIKDRTVYMLSRTTDELLVVDTGIKDLIYKQELASKPIDLALIDNKLYILCASNEMDVFNLDDFTLTQAMKFTDEGFSKKIVRVPDSTVFLITNIVQKKYYVYDYKKNEVLQIVDVPMLLSDLQLINRKLK